MTRVLIVLGVVLNATLWLSAGGGTGGALEAQTVRRDAPRAALMRVHYADVLAVQAAVVRGDLTAVRDPAQAVVAQPIPTGLAAAAAPFAVAMRAAATRAASAADLPTAAGAVSAMLAACGDCHRAAGTMPAAAVPPTPSVGGAVGHMLEHQRALDQMLQGLVIPSAESWRLGAAALETAPLRVGDLPRDPKLTPLFTRVEADVHRLAAEARAAARADERSRIYGTLVARCAECHGLHRKIWGPGAR